MDELLDEQTCEDGYRKEEREEKKDSGQRN